MAKHTFSSLSKDYGKRIMKYRTIPNKVEFPKAGQSPNDNDSNPAISEPPIQRENSDDAKEVGTVL